MADSENLIMLQGGSASGRSNALVIALLMLFLASCSLIVMTLIHLAEGIIQILAVIAGMLVASSAQSLTGIFQSTFASKQPRIQFTGAQEALLQQLPEAQKPSSVSSPSRRNNSDALLIDLLAMDPNAALARLRMDLESSLRHLAQANSIDVTNRPVSISQLIRLLDGQLDMQQQILLREIAQACNQAIHGATVDQQTAARIVDVGIQLMKALPIPQRTESEYRP
jgi:hypothetical protein